MFSLVVCFLHKPKSGQCCCSFLKDGLKPLTAQKIDAGAVDRLVVCDTSIGNARCYYLRNNCFRFVCVIFWQELEFEPRCRRIFRLSLFILKRNLCRKSVDGAGVDFPWQVFPNSIYTECVCAQELLRLRTRLRAGHGGSEAGPET